MGRLTQDKARQSDLTGFVFLFSTSLKHRFQPKHLVCESLLQLPHRDHKKVVILAFSVRHQDINRLLSLIRGAISSSFLFIKCIDEIATRLADLLHKSLIATPLVAPTNNIFSHAKKLLYSKFTILM